MLALLRRTPSLFIASLLLLLCGSVFLRLQFSFNAGHMDEYDYLFVGRQLLAGKEWATHIYIFGSDLSWYLLGLGERYLGGLQGARMVAGVMGLLSLAGLYAFVYALWRNHLTALIAVTLLATQSIHLFISRFATYDITSFAFFALSLAPMVLACQRQSRSRYWYLLLSVVLISLSVTSKYVVVLYLPFLAIVMFVPSPRLSVLFTIGVSCILVSYAALHWESLQTLYRVQIQNVHGGSNGSLEYILKSIFSYVLPALLGAVAAIVYVVYAYGRKALLQKQGIYLMVLGLLSLPIVAYHLNALNMISLYKHLVYANLFLLTATAWLLSQLIQSKPSHITQGVLSLLLVGYGVLNYQQLKQTEIAYGDVSPVISAIEGKLKADTTILSEDPYLFRYLAFDKVPQAHIKEPNWLDNNRDGLFEKKDVVEALWDAKFSYVYLNDQIHPNLNQTIRKILKLRGYKSIVSIDYKTSEVMSRQKKGALALYKRARKPTVELTDDDLFSRGKAMKAFLKESANE